MNDRVEKLAARCAIGALQVCPDTYRGLEGTVNEELCNSVVVAEFFR
jgi:hypothetical protein